MARFLFVYGYESPTEWENNRRSGWDDESSSAVWIDAPNEPDALAIGRDFAEQHVAAQFTPHPELQFPGWLAAGYAHWIEHHPLERFTIADLSLVRDILGHD